MAPTFQTANLRVPDVQSGRNAIAEAVTSGIKTVGDIGAAYMESRQSQNHVQNIFKNVVGSLKDKENQAEIGIDDARADMLIKSLQPRSEEIANPDLYEKRVAPVLKNIDTFASMGGTKLGVAAPDFNMAPDAFKKALETGQVQRGRSELMTQTQGVPLRSAQNPPPPALAGMSSGAAASGMDQSQQASMLQSRSSQPAFRNGPDGYVDQNQREPFERPRPPLQDAQNPAATPVSMPQWPGAGMRSISPDQLAQQQDQKKATYATALDKLFENIPEEYQPFVDTYKEEFRNTPNMSATEMYKKANELRAEVLKDQKLRAEQDRLRNEKLADSDMAFKRNLQLQEQQDAAARDRSLIAAGSRENVAGMRQEGKPDKVDKTLVQIDKTLRSDYIVKQRTTQLQYAQNTLDLLNSENPVANAAARTQIARLSGEVGVLTDRDIARFGGSEAFTSKLNQAIEKAMSGRLTKENKAFLIDVAATFKSASETSLNDRLVELAQGQSDAFEVPIDRIAPLINAYGVNLNFRAPSSGSAADSDPLGILN